MITSSETRRATDPLGVAIRLTSDGKTIGKMSLNDQELSLFEIRRAGEIHASNRASDDSCDISYMISAMSLASIATTLRGDRPSSPEVIADVIRTLILRGHLEGGEPLRQDTIARWFGVSHIPVRESLRQLTAEGLVQLHDKRGAAVAPLRPDEAEEILEIRLTLEIRAVSLAMPHWTEATFDDLEKLLVEAEACDSIDRWSDINRIFHEKLYQPCARPRLLNLIASLNANVERYIRLLVSRSDYRLQAQQEHRAILASARVRNSASLAALVEHHALETAVQLRQFLLLHQADETRGDRRKAQRRS
jgi:DNA-binding GntR family transcriptional regulator